jgi:probable rRNA maturation factor
MIEINSTVKKRIDNDLISRVVALFLKEYKREGLDVSISTVGEARMRRLNKVYRGIDRATDVLSFAEDGKDPWPGEPAALGEVVLCPAVIARQAGRFSHTPKEELAFILVHGLLHLIGRDDDTEKGRLAMIEEGKEFLKKIKR